VRRRDENGKYHGKWVRNGIVVGGWLRCERKGHISAGHVVVVVVVVVDSIYGALTLRKSLYKGHKSNVLNWTYTI